MCDNEIVLLSSDESDIDDSAPISSILAHFKGKPKDNVYAPIHDSTNDSAVQRCAVRRDFLSSDTDSDLPDLPSGFDCEPLTSSEQIVTDQVMVAVQSARTVEDSGEGQRHDVQVQRVQKVRVTRTASEKESQKLQAQVTKDKRAEERLMKKQQKENRKLEEARERKLRNEVKKQNRATDCKKYVTVLIDTGVVNDGFGAACVEAFSDSDSLCVTQELRVKNSIQWKRLVSELSQTDEDSPIDMVQSEVLEKDIVLVLTVTKFTQMVSTYKQVQKGDISGGMTLTERIQSVQSTLPQSRVTVVVLGMDKYFRQQKTNTQRRYRQEVLRDNGVAQARPKKGDMGVAVDRLDVEESVIDAQLQTDCNVLMLDTAQQLADQVHSFTKAIAEAPIKKDRLESAFSFHCEPLTGVKVDKNGHGLLKIWKNQIRQFRSVSADMADTIVAAYPSPRLLVEAYKKCTTTREAERLLENLQVRRGAGLLETNRRIGKELSRRVYQLTTCRDPGFVIK